MTWSPPTPFRVAFAEISIKFRVAATQASSLASIYAMHCSAIPANLFWVIILYSDISLVRSDIQKGAQHLFLQKPTTFLTTAQKSHDRNMILQKRPKNVSIAKNVLKMSNGSLSINSYFSDLILWKYLLDINMPRFTSRDVHTTNPAPISQSFETLVLVVTGCVTVHNCQIEIVTDYSMRNQLEALDIWLFHDYWQYSHQQAVSAHWKPLNVVSWSTN